MPGTPGCPNAYGSESISQNLRPGSEIIGQDLRSEIIGQDLRSGSEIIGQDLRSGSEIIGQDLKS